MFLLCYFYGQYIFSMKYALWDIMRQKLLCVYKNLNTKDSISFSISNLFFFEPFSTSNFLDNVPSPSIGSSRYREFKSCKWKKKYFGGNIVFLSIYIVFIIIVFLNRTERGPDHKTKFCLIRDLSNVNPEWEFFSKYKFILFPLSNHNTKL